MKPMPSLRACGARPSTGMGYPGSDGLAGRCPEITRRAISSEGRGLRAREYGPDGCRGLSFRIHALTMARWAIGNMPRSSPCLPRGRAEPALPRGGTSRARWPCGEDPGIKRRAFSRRDALRASERIGPKRYRYMASRTSSPLPRQLVPTFFSTRRRCLRYI